MALFTRSDYSQCKHNMLPLIWHLKAWRVAKDEFSWVLDQNDLKLLFILVSHTRHTLQHTSWGNNTFSSSLQNGERLNCQKLIQHLEEVAYRNSHAHTISYMIYYTL